jgi:hypothetical protein
MTNYIYQIDADGLSPADVAQMFARVYWDSPRQVENLRTRKGRTTFGVADGLRTYEVVFVVAVPGVSPAVYRVKVAE